LKIKGIIDDTHMEDKKVAIIFLDQQITSLELNMSGLSTSKSLVLASYLGGVLECSLKIQKVHPNERIYFRFCNHNRFNTTRIFNRSDVLLFEIIEEKK
jgi:hypothetical protein